MSRDPAMAKDQVDLLEPRIEQVLRRFHLPTEEAQTILDEVMLAMLTKRDRIRDPERWLLRTLKNRCLLYWRQRRQRLYKVIDTGLVTLLADSDVPRQEKQQLRAEIESLLAGLSVECRRHLEERYGLVSTVPEPAEGSTRPAGVEDVLRCVGALARRFSRGEPDDPGAGLPSFLDEDPAG